jgi:hypothetical protein
VELDGPPQARGAPGGLMRDRERTLDRMRQDFSRVGRAAAALALLALAAAGCGRNTGNVPADYAPSGTGGNNLLTVEMVKDSTNGQATPFVRLRIYDHSLANGYGLYRKLPGQGYERDSHDPFRFDGSFNERVETYEAVDHDWQPNRPVDYLGRGQFGGIETPASPTTNVATLPAAGAAESLFVSNITLLCPHTTAAKTDSTDSLPTFVWTPVPGATRYLLHVRRLDFHLFFYGFTPADGSHSYQMGTGLGDILHENTLSVSSTMYWSVEAIDSQWRVIGRSQEQSWTVVPLLKATTFCTP